MSTTFRWPRIAPGDRVVLVGPSGCGKTELAKSLLSTRRNALVIDTKGVEEWRDIGTPVTRKEVGRIRGGRFVFTVPDSFIVEPDEQSILLLALLRAGNRVVYLDELYDFLPTHGLKIIATKGRASKVGLWAATQRPFHVPLFTISEAQHFFVFGLRLDQDQKRMEQATGTQLPWKALLARKHSFVYVNESGMLHTPTKLLLE